MDMPKHRRRGKNKKTFRISLLLLMSAILVFLCLWYFGRNINQKTDTVVAPEVKLATTKNISTNLLFTGNIYLSRYINDWSMASPLKYAYPFSRLNEFDRQSYNAWIGGLECPVVAGISQTSAQENATLRFNCSPDYLPDLSKWFNIVTLANNHTDNQGVGGFTETQANLDKNNIQYFGHYDPRALNDICDVISTPVDVTLSDGTKKSGNLPVAMCGYNGVFRVPTDESAAVVKNYSDYMPVIAMPHMGKEYVASADQLKINFYRKLIDYGADMVLGDHPHWIQGSESYKGHLIVYSMGNFLFDQQDTTEVTRSAAIRLVMTSKDTGSILLDKWLLIGEQCKTYKDDCLNLIKEQGLKKVSLEYQFGVVGSNDAQKITKPATQAQTASILERLDWQNTMDNLQSPYISL